MRRRPSRSCRTPLGKIAQQPSPGLLFSGLAELVQFAAGSGIGCHLAVPIIFVPRTQKSIQLAPFAWRKLIDRSLNFSNRAHIENVRKGLGPVNRQALHRSEEHTSE